MWKLEDAFIIFPPLFFQFFFPPLFKPRKREALDTLATLRTEQTQYNEDKATRMMQKKKKLYRNLARNERRMIFLFYLSPVNVWVFFSFYCLLLKREGFESLFFMFSTHCQYIPIYIWFHHCHQQYKHTRIFNKRSITIRWALTSGWNKCALFSRLYLP